MHVLRLCSVYEAPPDSLRGRRGFDVVGGMQIHTARLTAELDALGVEQTVITAYRPGAPRVESVGERSRVIRAGVRVRRFRQLYGIAAIPQVARIGGVDLVHVHLGEDLAIAPLARWAASRAGAPLVVTVHCSVRHTLAHHDPRSAILRAIGGPAEAGLLRAAQAVLVLSDRLADQLAASGVPRSLLHVVPLGIDLVALREPRPRPAAMGGRRWVVFAGRLVPEKGVRDLVAAFAMVSTPDVGLLLVGEGADRARLEQLARGHGVDDRVRFVGSVPHPDIPAYLGHAELVVLPSWYEERGRILLEAMAAGAPVVAARTGGIPASVRDGVNGLLVPPRRPEALAAAIDRVLLDGALAASMRAAGRATASAHSVPALAGVSLTTYGAVLRRAAEGRRERVGLVEAG